MSIDRKGFITKLANWQQITFKWAEARADCAKTQNIE